MRLSGLILYFGLRLLKPIREELEKQIEEQDEKERSRKLREDSIEVEYKIIK